jgi:Ca2+:H+ antiporter
MCCCTSLDFLVVQSSLIGSVFSNLLLVLGMCFFCGGMYYPEQKFISQGAVAFIALLGVSGLTLLMPEFFGDNEEEDLTISRIGAVLLILLYLQLLYFQLSSHSHLFEGEDDTVALIPFSWALIGMVVVTAMVTILSDWLVGSIDGFCVQFNLSHSFVGVIVIPVVGNAVEHISAVSVAMKNKMDLAIGGKSLSLCLLL